ncbi:hypothetical protein OH492_10145 [Vibrio chagasii]|nr:hypothetical protein [Vibrio chagasii]
MTAIQASLKTDELFRQREVSRHRGRAYKKPIRLVLSHRIAAQKVRNRGRKSDDHRKSKAELCTEHPVGLCNGLVCCLFLFIRCLVFGFFLYI